MRSISPRARCSSASNRAIAGSFRSGESFVDERERAGEELHLEEPHYAGLAPVGFAKDPERYDLRGIDDEELAAIGAAGGRNLDLDKMSALRRIQEEMGLAQVTDVLVEAVDARWSDHCMHTTWISLGHLLRKLAAASTRTANPNILSMFEDNAGSGTSTTAGRWRSRARRTTVPPPSPPTSAS